MFTLYQKTANKQIPLYVKYKDFHLFPVKTDCTINLILFFK